MLCEQPWEAFWGRDGGECFVPPNPPTLGPRGSQRAGPHGREEQGSAVAGPPSVRLRRAPPRPLKDCRAVAPECALRALPQRLRFPRAHTARAGGREGAGSRPGLPRGRSRGPAEVPRDRAPGLPPGACLPRPRPAPPAPAPPRLPAPPAATRAAASVPEPQPAPPSPSPTRLVRPRRRRRRRRHAPGEPQRGLAARQGRSRRGREARARGSAAPQGRGGVTLVTAAPSWRGRGGGRRRAAGTVVLGPGLGPGRE